MVGTLVCKCCEEIIEHYEDEKVSVLYGVCPDCQNGPEEK